MSALLTRLRSRLPAPPVTVATDTPRRRAAVALLLRSGIRGEELFLVERAPHDADPWSGNLAFPGGKEEPEDEDPRLAAERETREEVGIDLRQAEYLGFLTEIVGAHLPVRVACYVYYLPGPPPRVVRSHEIADAFWVPLATLLAPERQITAPVIFAGETHQVKAIRLPQPGKPVLWGITYRLFQHFAVLITEDACAY